MSAVDSSSSPSPPAPPFHGYWRRVMALLAVVPLALVSVVVLAEGTKSLTSSWLTPYALFSPHPDIGGRGLGGSGAYAKGGVAAGIQQGVAVGDNIPVNAPGSPPNGYHPPATPSSPPTRIPAQLEVSDDGSRSHWRRRRDAKLKRLELGLAKARAAIRDAARNSTGAETTILDTGYVPRGPIYRNPSAFHRSYLEMEKLFKVYVYEEGEPPLFHDGPCRSIYSSEGRFINGLDMDNHFRTTDPDLAHVHFLPFRVAKMIDFIYLPDSRNTSPMTRTIADYINLISQRHPYWNRSLGADHFMLSCHDWGPMVSKAVAELYSNSIRVLCNANTSEGFNPAKDAALPEINIKNDDLVGMLGGPSPSRRPILAFFAGGNHGPVRQLVLKVWKGKDEDVQVHEYLPKGVSYYDYMRRSKFCLCPSGYEVASPRIVEAIYLGCVPVTINSHYVLPFSDVLDWKAFSVDVPLEDIPNLKKILRGISQRQYIRMHRRVETVRRHFMVNGVPERFDMYHMLLHSVWLRRLNVRIYPQMVD